MLTRKHETSEETRHLNPAVNPGTQTRTPRMFETWSQLTQSPAEPQSHQADKTQSPLNLQPGESHPRWSVNQCSRCLIFQYASECNCSQVQCTQIILNMCVRSDINFKAIQNIFFYTCKHSVNGYKTIRSTNQKQPQCIALKHCVVSCRRRNFVEDLHNACCLDAPHNPEMPTTQKRFPKRSARFVCTTCQQRRRTYVFINTLIFGGFGSGLLLRCTWYWSLARPAILHCIPKWWSAQCEQPSQHITKFNSELEVCCCCDTMWLMHHEIETRMLPYSFASTSNKLQNIRVSGNIWCCSFAMSTNECPDVVADHETQIYSSSGFKYFGSEMKFRHRDSNPGRSGESRVS